MILMNILITVRKLKKIHLIYLLMLILKILNRITIKFLKDKMNL